MNAGHEIGICDGPYCLVLDPLRGGSIVAFEWNGNAIMRPACGAGILDVSCFPLVPFVNRIDHGLVPFDEGIAHLPPNMPAVDPVHPLHGFGWLSAWDIRSVADDAVVLDHYYVDGEWPWPYTATQAFKLDHEGLWMQLSVTNKGITPMPAGLGFHPYFPLTDDTRYIGLHRGQWLNSSDGLPRALEEYDKPCDWWAGEPVMIRAVDTVYTNRKGKLQIEWLDRKIGLSINPSNNLRHTAVYCPQGQAYFCIEPVSHITNAINMTEAQTDLYWLSQGETVSVEMQISAYSLTQ